MVTAAEAYPEMERAFLGAQSEIWASFRVFDLSTQLRSDEALRVGETWFDLVVNTLERGVAIHMVLSDFDPILAPKLHCASWSARRAFIAAGEAAGSEARLNVVNATHSARVGWLPRLLLWPRTVREVARHARALNAMTSSARLRRLQCSPGLRPWLKTVEGGTLRACKWPPPPLVPGTHHQKLAVFDRKRLCIGGLDLDERRYDDTAHQRSRDETWHDVQIMCRGAVVEEAQRHLETFLPAVAGRKPAPDMTLLLRTLSRRRRVEAPHLGPRPVVDELARAHHDMIGQARKLIYMETQFFRDRALADKLAEAARKVPELGLMMVLPGAPEDIAFDGNTSSDARFGEYLQAQCIRTVQDAFGDRVGFFSPAKPVKVAGSGRDTLCGAPIIYVHAKVSIFDDDNAIVSSANLNGRSLAWDTEAGVALTRSETVHDLRMRTFQHWLWDGASKEHYDLGDAVRAWVASAQENARSEPLDRKGFLLPHDPKPAAAFGRGLPGVPEALV